MTYIYGLKEFEASPPHLTPHFVSRKAAVSAYKPGKWLIRAWCPARYGAAESAKRLTGWIFHHIGRMDHDGIIWYGYTYEGLPTYMGSKYHWTSGLTIQHCQPPPDKWWKEHQEDGTYGYVLSDPVDLEIPEKGQVQRR